MARKGSRKTRTGCITCKIRKVKCDEAKPSCNRCTTTGRQCDGYVPLNSMSARQPNSDLRQYRPDHVFPGISSAGEGRALQYFCETAGSYLSGSIDPYFMSKLVMQFTSFEPAARHSVVAISTLCERMSGHAEKGIRLQDETFALSHYNAAIHDLRAMTSEKQPVVLLVCLLFICLELLQSNRDAAMQHCKHGFTILQHTTSDSAWTKEHLLPLFRRLSVFTFLYTDDVARFPSLLGLEHPVPDTFSTFSDAQIMIDDIFSRTLRLVRQGDPYRIHPPKRGRPVPPELLLEQDNIKGLLDQWKSLFEDFEARPPSCAEDSKLRPKNLTETSRCVLLSRYGSCRIWANIAFGTGGYGHERHREAPDRAFEGSGVMDPKVWATVRRSPNIICDSGYVPTISLISTRCHHLEARLEALNLVPVPGLPRENLCLQSLVGRCNAASAWPPDRTNQILPLSFKSSSS